MNHPVTIILVEPENPDNIGAVARAMKNMGLSDLCLVRPVRGWKEKGKKMAVSGYDVLEKARVCESVQEAVLGMHLVVGTTRRRGPKRGQLIALDKIVKEMKRMRKKHRVAVMFGRESKGLDNESLGVCDWVTTIPANPVYPSLNLAQAVMVMAFSLFDQDVKMVLSVPRRGALKNTQAGADLKIEPIYLPKEEVQEVLDRLEKALRVLGYGRKGNDITGRIRATFHRLFKRSGLMESEAQMFRGMVRRICDVCGDKTPGIQPPAENFTGL